MDPQDIFLGNERGISKDLPNEHHWWDIDWIISGCKSLGVRSGVLVVVIAYCNHKQLDSDKLEGVIRNPSAFYFPILCIVLSKVAAKRFAASCCIPGATSVAAGHQPV